MANTVSRQSSGREDPGSIRGTARFPDCRFRLPSTRKALGSHISLLHYSLENRSLPVNERAAPAGGKQIHPTTGLQVLSFIQTRLGCIDFMVIDRLMR